MAGFLLLALAPALPAGQEKSAADLLGEMRRQFETTQDYEVIVHSQVPTPGRKDRYLRYRCEWLRRRNDRQTNMFRIDVREGDQDWDELVIRQDGSVRGRRDDLLRKNFPVTLKRSDPRLRDAEGVWLSESDFGSLIARLSAGCSRATSDRVNPVPPAELKALRAEIRAAIRRLDADFEARLWKREEAAYRLEMSYVDDQNREVNRSLLISQKTLMPLRYTVSRDGQLLQTLTFDRFERNKGKGLSRFRF